MNVETLVTILVVSLVIATIVRLFAGWSLSSWLLTFVLAVVGAVGGWQFERRFGLPAIYTFPFPSNAVGVSVIWSSLGALVLALLGSVLIRPRQRLTTRRRRYR